MKIVPILSVLALAASSAHAQTAPADQRSPTDAAKAFSLDLPAPATPANPDTPPLVAFTLDTPIEQLIADSRAKTVLDKDLPGLSGDANLSKFQSKSLRQFQPMTGGQMSDALLAKTGADLAALGSSTAPAPVAAVPPTSTPATHRKVDSGR